MCNSNSFSKMKKEEKKKEEDKRVDVNNDAEMVALGIRNPFVTPRDPSVWTKTEKERKAWKKQRRFPAPDSRWAPPARTSRFVGRLIVNVKGLDKTTYRHDCPETDIPYLLSKYKSEHSSIVRAFWNGKEIDPERLLKQAV
jgi:hypothetical protein|nr:MAG TPA: hypothetical protein [Caudoviricetes sp.]DAN75112.1 MAG TPA: hypothetical protein [Caudoviricetes sp.]